MAKNKALSIPTVLSSEIGVDKDDLIAIKVAAVETELINSQAQSEQDLRGLKKSLKQHNEAAAAAAKTAGEAAFDTKSAIDALKVLGITVKATVSVNFDEVEGTIKASLRISSDDRYGSGFSSESDVKPTAAIKKLCGKIADTAAEIEETQTRMIDIRKRLSQMGTLERQAKAAMAQTILKESEEGRALLATLSDVKGLPEVK